MIAFSKESLAIQIRNDLREQIINQTIPCGTRINARKLQTQYNTSSTPVREALNLLVADLLVEYESNVGCRVITFSKQDIAEINDLVALLDSHAVACAMESPDIDTLTEQVNELVRNQQLAYDQQDEAQYRACAEGFHHIFYQYAGNARLSVLSKKYNSQMKMLAARYESSENKKISIREHLLIYHAVKDRDVETATRYMRQHIFETRDMLLENFDTMMK